MAHIHTEPGQYDFTVSAFIVRVCPHPVLLLHRHKTLGMLLQPGGHVELNESPWEALTHEVREETGYDMDQLRVLQPRLRPPVTSATTKNHPQPVYVHSHPFGAGINHNHTDIAFAFATEEPPRHGVGEAESTDLRWLDAEEIRRLDPDQTPENVRIGALFILNHLLQEWESVDTALF